MVSLSYRGTPEVVTDPDGSIEGWVPTADGAFVVGEPQGSPSWFPSNDNPRDKATYDIAVTVPNGITAMSNGVLTGTWSRGGRTTWAWRESSPMATYLATATLGTFQLSTSRVAGIPSHVAVDPSQAADSAPVLAQLPDIVTHFSSLFGRYPFDAVGAIVDDAPEVGPGRSGLSSGAASSRTAPGPPARGSAGPTGAMRAARARDPRAGRRPATRRTSPHRARSSG